MELNDWERIENLFHEALPLEAEKQAAFLHQACLGNDQLRSEVESLLAAVKGRENFIEIPAFDLGLRVLSGTETQSMTGRLIGPYKILNQLGKGGMGEVYLAEDTRLERKVALKFLSAKLVDDNWAKRQLVKEAQSAAMLEHPNICAIYGIEEAEGHSFIVMQYVEGETLAAIIRQQPPGVPQAISLAVQIASAVSEAHAHGIIHRDIKPQNIVVNPNGHVKVLDFGLAKSIQRKQSAGLTTDDTSRISQSGLIVGTVAYMSPEQLRGERLDFRSDMFSLGTVLYELLSGKRPFARNSDAEVISAILTSNPPPITRDSDDVSSELSDVIFKCLEKNKEHRYSSASELLYELNRIQNSGHAHMQSSRVRYLGLRAAILLFCVVLAIASVFAYLHVTRVQTLAVLPIASQGSDSEVEPIARGLTEDLINKLSHFSRLRVKAFTLVSGYNSQQTSPQDLGRSLRVDAVLASTLVRQGDAFVLQTSLIDTADGAQLWGEKYNMRPDQVLDTQDQVSERIVSSLALWVGDKEKKRLSNHPTNNHEALSEYYKGRDLWEKRSKKNIQEALIHFQRAVELDPSYARAYAGQADCYVLLNTVAYGSMPTDESMKKARATALRALEIDSQLPEAHTSLGIVKLKYEWNWLEAEAQFRQAISINPEFAWAHYWYAQLLAITGRSAEALSESQTASDLAPFSPIASMGRCRAFYLSRSYGQAEDCSKQVLASYPGNVSAQYVLSYVYIATERYMEAIDILEGIFAKDKQLAAAALGLAYGRSGRKTDAMKILDIMNEMSQDVYLPPQEAAIVYVGLGKNDEAFAWLEKSYAERFTTLIFIAADPIYDSLRSDSRYYDLLRRLNLASSGPPA